jgi:hypothetical protein
VDANHATTAALICAIDYSGYKHAATTSLLICAIDKILPSLHFDV